LTGAEDSRNVRGSKSRPCRIALVLPNLGGGGAEAVNLTLAREFVARGYKVDLVLAKATGVLIDRIPKGVRVIDLSARRLVYALGVLRGYLRREKPHAVLAGVWPMNAIAIAARLGAGVGTRMIVCDHNTLSLTPEWAGRLKKVALRVIMAVAYRRADARVAVSKGVARDVAHLSLMPVERFDVIHNPIAAPSDAMSATESSGLWANAKGARILAVGSLKRQKNHALLLRAFARLTEERPAVLTILGEGSLRRELERLVAELDLADRVRLPGFVSDPSEAYRSADLFVLTSDYEGFGNVIVEALASGTPVVSTDCPNGPAEILDGGRYGELVPCGDPDALALGMQHALDTQHDYEALRARARDFAPSVAADAYLRLMFGDSSPHSRNGRKVEHDRKASG
jgi:glycosyltransferase involved in cell wall biosynthesis